MVRRATVSSSPKSPVQRFHCNRMLSGLLRIAAIRRTHPAAVHCQLIICRALREERDVSQNGEVKAPHVPVLLNEVLSSFCDVNMRVYVDCTLGAGGHARAIATQHPELEMLIGIDQDPYALQTAQHALHDVVPEHSLITLHGNFRHVRKLLRSCKGKNMCGSVSGMLMDLGVSSMQIDIAQRGFSYRNDGPLDMRMNPKSPLSAADVVNAWSESQLGRAIKDYGEDRGWRSIARRIIEAREQGGGIETTRALVNAICRCDTGVRGIPRGAVDTLSRVFQALRIVVNDELLAVEQAIPAAIECLEPGGRLAVITFHSLEDRIVKRAFQSAAGRKNVLDEDIDLPRSMRMLDELPVQQEVEASVKLITKKVIKPTAEECAKNSRSRSAKLRVVEKL